MEKKYCALLVFIALLFSCHLSFASKLVIVGEPHPPYLFMKGGDVVGIDAEIIKHVMGKLGIEYTFVLCPLIRCLAMLEQGHVDMGVSMSKSLDVENFAHYPVTFTRNAEYVLITNSATKLKFNATSLSYAKANNFRLGVIRGDYYDNRLWQIFPFTDGYKWGYSTDLTPLKGIRQGLKMLSLNRIEAVLGEQDAAGYTALEMGIKNIVHYDFVAFFKAKYSAFSKHSHYKSDKYKDVNQVLSAYEKVLSDFKKSPAFFDIFNWDWRRVAPYPSKPINHSKPTQGETIHIGFLADLTGPSAGWGKPGLTGIQLYLERINAAGGLLVGTVQHPLELHVIDDKSDPKRALLGAKKMVEKHQVKFISGIGGGSADAIHPYLTDNNVIYASLIATDINPKRPFLLAGGDVTPRIDMLRPWYHKNQNSNLKRWAVLSQNDPVARSSQAWEVGAAVAEGWEVVYDKHFSLEITDFHQLVAEVLRSKPDVVSLNLTWPSYATLIMEQLYKQGFRGEISANYMDVEANLKKVPEWFHEGVVDSFPLFDDPFWGNPSIQHDFHVRWLKQYGAGAPKDIKRGINGIDWDHLIMLKVWAFGAQVAGSFDPQKVIDALRAQKSFPTLLGKAKMTGQQMWGIQNMVSPPIPINETRGGVKRIQTVKRFEEWFDRHKKVIIDVVKSKGYYWEK
jgi:branched-chain amino acid transport system substrate-binding protein